ncbi:MAG: hypothetical protein SGI89_09220 [bacterium]|nr:hypothetical protein [bacterium]
MKEFEKLVASPFFSTGRNLLPFFKSLKKFYPDFNDERLTEQSLFKSLYPGKSFSKDTINKLLTDLLKLSFEYIKQLAVRKNPIVINSIVSKEALIKNLNSIALKIINKEVHNLESKKLDVNYFFDMENIEMAKAHYYYYNQEPLLQFKHDMEFSEFIINKFIVQASIQLENLTFWKNYGWKEIEKNGLMILFDSIDIEKIIGIMKDLNMKSRETILSLISLYSIYAYKNISDHKYYNEYRNIIFNNLKLFSDELKYDIINSLRILTLLKSNISQSDEFERAAFEINDLLVKEKIYINPNLNYLSKNEFQNYFRTAFDLEEFDWAEKFVKNYSKEIKEEERAETVNYCKASLSFAKKDFDNCFKYLNLLGASSTDKSLNYYLKAAIYYDQEHFDEAESVLNSYFKFVRRGDNIRKDRKEFHYNYIKCLRNLINFEFHKDEKYIINLEIEIGKACNKVLLKYWLKEKLLLSKKRCA